MLDTEGLQSNSLDAFLGFLYEGLDGYVAVAELHPGPTKNYMKHSFYHWPLQREAMSEHIQAAGETINTYITPAVFSQPIAQKQYFLGSKVAWVEFDGSPNYGGHKPTVRIQSSGPGHEHWYYLLTTPVNSIHELERYNKALAYTQGGDKGGWDAVQLLRPIGTVNQKYTARPRVHVLNVFPDSLWPKGELDRGWTDPEAQVEITEAPLVLPKLEEVILKHAWGEKVAELLQWKTCPPGQRSDSLMALGYYMAEMGLPEIEMLAVLIHKDNHWGKFKDRPDRLRQLQKIITVAKNKHPDKEVKQPDSVIVAGWNDILAYDVDFSWVIENMLLENTTLVLGGKPDVGKTQVSMRFGMNMALGRDEFLDFRLNGRKKILFMSLELGIVPIKMLTKTMSAKLSPEDLQGLQENFITAAVGQSMNFAEPRQQDEIRRLIDRVEPDGIMVDSLGKSIPGGLKNTENVMDAMNFLNKLNNEGLFAWAIHHLRKDTQDQRKRTPDLDDLFGDQYIGAFARSVYGLANNGHGLELLTLKNNFAAKPGYSLRIQRQPDLDFVKTGIVTDEEKEESKSHKASKLFGE